MDIRFQPAGFCSKDGFLVDTTLSLDSSGASSLYTSSNGNNKRKWSDVDNGFENSEDDFSLIIGTGRPSNSSDNSKMSSTTACTMSSAKETDEETSMDLDLNFQLHLESDTTNSPNKHAFDAVDLQLSLPTRSSLSAVTHQNRLELYESIDASVPGDDGSTSSRWKSGYGGSMLPSINSMHSAVPSLATSLSTTAVQKNTSCIPGFALTQLRRHNNSRTCLFQDCKKGARGASGLCIGHGGGRRCQREGCVKGAEGRTVYCKAHGGGRRCDFLRCTKSAEGRTDYCIAHGGGSNVVAMTTTTTTTTNSNKFCCLSREDIVRFIICYLGTLNPIPLSSISVLGAITKDYIYTEASSSAIQSVQKLPPIDPCSIAVVETNADGSLRIIGEISACKLWKCDYLSAACALANLSAGQFVMGVNDNTSSPFSSQDCAGGNSSLKKMAAPPWPEDGGGGSTRSRKFSSKNLGYVNKPHNPNYFPENNMYRGRSAPLICKNTSSLAAVMAQMLSHRATHVWVTEADSDDVLVGIVGYTDILHAVTTNFATSSSSGSISVGGGASCITTA